MKYSNTNLCSHLEPSITLTASDHKHLSGLARAAIRAMPEAAANLADELDRAQVLAKGRRPTDVVGMGCEVEFRDESNGRVQKLMLVYPSEADIEQGKVSVLTPGRPLRGKPEPVSSSGSLCSMCAKRRRLEQPDEIVGRK